MEKEKLVEKLNELLKFYDEKDSAEQKIDNLTKLIKGLEDKIINSEDNLLNELKDYFAKNDLKEIHVKDRNLDIFKLSINNGYLSVKKITII